ncbi:AAA family ATPase [Hugenholtzia roseola]|uniref:AAA family ATPase n=1 Tax=Hugenholtzia roseola TaxID=1002 RepID=UPI0004001C7A|nr:AAA family ATPase [Hugenholtzia roseola]
MQNTNRNHNGNARPNHETENLLGRYNVFGDGYFSEDYLLLNKFGKKLIDFSVREYFENNQLVNLKKFIAALEKEGLGKVTLYRRNTGYNKKEERFSIDWYLFLKDDQMVVNIDYDAVKDLNHILFRMDTITSVEDTTLEQFLQVFEIAKTCVEETEDDRKRYINIVGSTPRTGLSLRKHEIKAPKIPDLDLYYGKGFDSKHQMFLEGINEKNRSGLFIFHGVTGSGKTNYIRYLISCSRPELEYIFYPISLLREIASPELITFLSDYQDAVLIIEESEESVQARDSFIGDKSSIANLLNVSDGLLSDVLNLKIICTFNTDIRNLDKALLREGRLLGIHRFDKIDKENANQIASLNKIDKSFDEDVTLAQIFNRRLNEDFSDFIEKDKKMGFGL